MLPVWAGEMLAKINLSVSCFEILAKVVRIRKLTREGSFSRDPQDFDSDGNDVTGSVALQAKLDI